MISWPSTSEYDEEMSVPTSSQEALFAEEWPEEGLGPQYGGAAAYIFAEAGPVFQVELTEPAEAGVSEIDDIAPILIERHRESLSELANS